MAIRPRIKSAAMTKRSRERASAAQWQTFGIITRSRRMHAVLLDAAKAAPTDLPVLILGESGVGKELVARLVHHLSGLPGQFVPVNCAALPGSVIETELFGSVRGAFTGAENRTGLVGVTGSGTLFLDEIGTMPPELQTKLLRFLETGEYRPVGSDRGRVGSCRVVSATNADLAEAIGRGDFRRDLYYRLAGTELEIPPLRRRVEDIVPLVRHFCADPTGPGPCPHGVDPALMTLLERYRWPGNVRELRNVIWNARSRCRRERALAVSHVSAPVLQRIRSARAISRQSRQGQRRHQPDEIIAALTRTHGNVRRAAELLSLSRQHLYRLIRELNLSIDHFRK